MTSDSVLCVIPARGGSKGLPNKNVLPLGGKPLIAWTIEAARECAEIGEVIVSTDDARIAEISRQFGAAVPFLRPAVYSSDSASSESVLQHALEWFETHNATRVDVVVYLQTTDPFRTRGIIGRVLGRLMSSRSLDTVFAARPEHKNYWTSRDGEFRPLGRHNHQPRQSKPPVFREDTGIALASRAEVIRQGRRIGDRVDIVPHESPGDFIDIHTDFDLRLANLLMEKLEVIPNA